MAKNMNVGIAIAIAFASCRFDVCAGLRLRTADAESVGCSIRSVVANVNFHSWFCRLRSRTIPKMLKISRFHRLKNRYESTEHSVKMTQVIEDPKKVGPPKGLLKADNPWNLNVFGNVAAGFGAS